MKAAAFLTAEWRNLAMLNFEVDPDILRKRVPSGTELDSFQKKHYVSMVGFLFLNTRVLGVPIPFHRDFEEVNLRFYVRRKVEGEWRRGVVFIKEIVPRFAISAVARTIYQENYISLPMRHSLAPSVSYEWRFLGRWNEIRVTPCGTWQAIPAGSEEEFIAEHYWGYSRTMEYQVEHPPWRIQQVKDALLNCAAAKLYGPEFESVLRTNPDSAFLAEGSQITVRKGAPL